MQGAGAMSANYVRSQRRFGFTLVELLVVISIVVALIAILLPALQRARANAQSIQCLSNLREQGLVIASYVAENEGKLPYARVQTNQKEYNSDISWPGLIQEGRLPKGNTIAVVRVNNYNANASAVPVYAPGILQCPTGPYTSDPALTDYQTGSESLGRSYAPAHFRNSSTMYQVLTGAGGDDSSAIYAYPDKVFGSHYMQVYSTYGMNVMDSNAESGAAGGVTGTPGSYGKPNVIMSLLINGVFRSYQSGFANAVDTAGKGNGTPDGGAGPCLNYQRSIGMFTNSSDTWMAWDGCGSQFWTGFNGNANSQIDFSAGGIIFRHPNLSCNFLYYDGHAENLRAGDVDGNPCSHGAILPTNFGVVADARLLPVH
jgi:prepilin-type N-terminal cleavage/methylation domain-containing protein/prepilin-type processing-associated H-X9-DG protein